MPIKKQSSTLLITKHYGKEKRGAHTPLSYLDKIKITYLFCRKLRSEHSALDGS